MEYLGCILDQKFNGDKYGNSAAKKYYLTFITLVKHGTNYGINPLQPGFAFLHPVKTLEIGFLLYNIYILYIYIYIYYVTYILIFLFYIRAKLEPCR